MTNEATDGIATIVQGEDRTLTLWATDEKGNPFSLSGNTEISVKFPGTTTTVERKKTDGHVTVVSADAGKFQCTLTAANTAAMKSGSKQSFQAEVTFASGKRIVVFDSVLTVKKAPV